MHNGKTPLLSVQNLRTYFFQDEGTVKAVDGASFDIALGQTLGVVGESGCGKSVTARSILRIVEPPGRIVSGQILWYDATGRAIDLVQLDPNGQQMRSMRGGQIGLVFQEPMTSFSPVHTVGDQLIETIRLHMGLSKREARHQAIALLRQVGVPQPERRIDEYAFQLSGGLRQRAMIAVALSCNPRLLIADEPTTALDVTTQAQILDLLRELQQQRGMAIMLITHNLGVVAEMADTVAVMYLGRVVEVGPVDAIFHDAHHPYTKALLRSIPSIHSVPRARLYTITGSIPHPYNRPSGCPFHPRCPDYQRGVCDASEPVLSDLGDGHWVSCFLYEPATVGMAAFPPKQQAAISLTVRANTTPVTPAILRAQEQGNVGSAAADGISSASRADGNVLLDVRGLRKFFPIRKGFLQRVVGHIRAVDDVSFFIRQGETFSLVGESGCGKTTTSRCILRAVHPTAGQILFRTEEGQVVDIATLSQEELKPLRRQMQMIFQDPYSSLNPRMTLLDIVGEPLLVNGMTNRNERAERVAELLRLVGLRPEYMRRFPHAFSGGQRQRIGIARALALRPRLIVADEPVSALDVSVQAQILNLLLELQAELGLTYLFVAHDLSVVKHISDRVAVMYVGRIVETATTHALFYSPLHPYTEALLSAVPKPDPRLRSQRIILQGSVADPANPPTGCYFHPRCRYAVEICCQQPPLLQEMRPDHFVACHRAGELKLQGASA